MYRIIAVGNANPLQTCTSVDMEREVVKTLQREEKCSFKLNALYKIGDCKAIILQLKYNTAKNKIK